MATAQNARQDDALADALQDAQSSLDEMNHVVEGATGAELQALSGGIEMLSDVDLEVTIELGRTEMLVEDVLKLGAGSVVELDKLAGDPVDIYVNGRHVARGEVLVLNDNFCIRVSEIIADLDQSVQELEQAAEQAA